MIRGIAVWLVVVLVLGVSATSAYQQSHKVEIIPLAGYQFGGKVNVYLDNQPGEIEFKSAGNFGVAIDIPMGYGKQVELLYSRQDSEVRLKSYVPGDTKLADAAIEYYHVGALAGLPRDNILPFGSFTLGATHINPKGVAVNGEWRFSIALGLGAKVYLSERLGLRVHGQLRSVIVNSGAGFWCGTGGCGLNYGGDAVFQGDISAGLMILL
jgi:hypothetical protein